MQKKKKRRSLKHALLVSSLAAVVAVPSMLAYLTDTDEAVNKFSTSEGLTVEVVESKWDGATDTDADGIPDFAENILPGETIEKDPKAIISAGTDAYVFAEVRIPMKSVKIGTQTEASEQELFAFELNSGWTQMSKVAEDGYMVYTFAADSTVAVDGETPTIFDAVTYANVVSGELDNAEIDIPVTMYAIQAEGFENADEAWEAFTAQHVVYDGVSPIHRSLVAQSVQVPSAQCSLTYQNEVYTQYSPSFYLFDSLDPGSETLPNTTVTVGNAYQASGTSYDDYSVVYMRYKGVNYIHVIGAHDDELFSLTTDYDGNIQPRRFCSISRSFKYEDGSDDLVKISSADMADIDASALETGQMLVYSNCDKLTAYVKARYTNRYLTIYDRSDT